ncbi:MAG: hypothetical protein ACI9FJ_001273 [Alteromonadaceae bacterium]|jgi:hypothetical protein
MNILSSQIAATNKYQSQFESRRQVSQIKSAAGQPNIRANAQVTDQQTSQRNLLTQVQSSTDLSGLTLPSSIDNTAPGRLDSLGKEQTPLSESSYYDRGLFVMKMLLERMTGKAIQLFNPQEFMNKANDIEQVNRTNGNTEDNPNDVMLIEQYEFERQSNQLSFSGSITLEDGRQSQFSYAVAFSQRYESLSVEMVKRHELKDPLIISFTSKPVELSNKRFDFDIDADNKTDKIPLLEAGYGFLALDKNKDGVINNGSELFGALSGNGFADLAAYDDDQNGFIDENDKVFSQLSVWVKTEDNNKLMSLKDSGIGAVSLQNADTPYTVRNDDEKLAIIRKSGFYLNEDGTPGLIQQLDFIV